MLHPSIENNYHPLKAFTEISASLSISRPLDDSYSSEYITSLIPALTIAFAHILHGDNVRYIFSF